MAKEKNCETRQQRALRLARLQKKIAAGTYRVDTPKLAAKIVEAHRKKPNASQEAKV